MQGKHWQILQFVIFLGLAVLLTWLAFAGQDLQGIWGVISEANLGWVVAALLLALLGQVARAARWRLLLRSAGEEVSLTQALISLLNGYFVNLGVPRLGEITRCGALNRLAGTSVLSAAGSVVAERAVDVLVLLGLVALFFVLAGQRIQTFFMENIGEAVGTLWTEKGSLLLLLAGIGLLGLAALYLLARRNRVDGQPGILMRLRAWAAALWAGLVSALMLGNRQKLQFLLLTLVIWVCYYGASVLALLALGLQGEAFFELAFAVFLFGSMARTVPLPAGSMGAYHFIVAAVMVHYGFSEIEGLGLATLNHGIQTLFHLLTGAASFAVFVWLQRRKVTN